MTRRPGLTVEIARSIDWEPTCLPGTERETIVRQILDLAEHDAELQAKRTAERETAPPVTVADAIVRARHETWPERSPDCTCPPWRPCRNDLAYGAGL